jgi:DNA-binding CsgD family transcriptional regulator
MIAPFVYALVLLWVMFRAIHRKYVANRNRKEYLEEIAMYCAISPWASLAVFGFVEESQLLEVLCTNTGIVFISLLFIWKSIRSARVEYWRLMELSRQGLRPEVFEENCQLYHFTNREIQIIVLLRQGLTYYKIGEKLFISRKTVSNHVQHIYEKTGVNNKIALTHKLYQ